MMITLTSLIACLAICHTAISVQPSAPDPLPAPLRELHWGQLNFLHTTDIHGWFSGHLRESSFSADWGDYVSFVEHMRCRADAAGSDLLVIDTGDRVEGSGLYDMADPPGKYLYDIFKQQPVDLLCVGNHELYKASTAEAEYNIIAKQLNESYVSSNVDIYDPDTGYLVPLAQRYKKFTTKNQGIRIMAFGFLFNFDGNANNTVVHTVEDTIRKSWFQSAIRDPDVDLFLIVGHVPVHSSENTALFRAIRSVRWDLPIQFFGGHYHIRDYARYDAKAYGLASGRFLETVGFMSISGLTSAYSLHSGSRAVSFHRRYIDHNLYSLQHHSGTNESTFHTKKGLLTSKMIELARKELNIDRVFGCAPASYWMSRARYPQDKNSIYTWMSKYVLQSMLRNDSRRDMPAFVMVNTGAVRFDILKGPFTPDSAATFSPFTSIFKYAKEVPYSKALRLMDLLNTDSPIIQAGLKSLPGTASQQPLPIPEEIGHPHDIAVSDANHHDGLVFVPPVQAPLRKPDGSYADLVPGYTTTDDAGHTGDDTVHSHIPYYHTPNTFSSLILPALESPGAPALLNSKLAWPEKVDLVYNDFLEPWVAAGARIVGLDFNVTNEADIYLNKTVAQLAADWVKENWKCEDAEQEVTRSRGTSRKQQEKERDFLRALMHDL